MSNNRNIEYRKFETLQALADYLNSATGEDWDMIDASMLPTFGGPDIENPAECYSWDEKSILVSDSGNGNWGLIPRCPICGDANFHCHHDAV